MTTLLVPAVEVGLRAVEQKRPTSCDIVSKGISKQKLEQCVAYVRSVAEGNAAAIRALFGKEEYFAPETVLECTGVEPSICTAAYTARRGGNVVVIGVGKSIVNNLPFMHLSLAEVGPRYVFYRNCHTHD